MSHFNVRMTQTVPSLTHASVSSPSPLLSPLRSGYAFGSHNWHSALTNLGLNVHPIKTIVWLPWWQTTATTATAATTTTTTTTMTSSDLSTPIAKQQDLPRVIFIFTPHVMNNRWQQLGRAHQALDSHNGRT